MIGVGDTVRYVLDQIAVDTVAHRRGIRGRHITTDMPEALGHGSPLAVGQVAPMIVTVVSTNGAVNGQVLLDGDDSLWVTGVMQGTGPGTWQ